MRENALLLLCLEPFLALLWKGFHAGLGVNPVERVEHVTGDWALRFFCLTLLVTPVARASGASWWARRRRMIGLFVAFYAALHFLTYLIFDVEGSLGDFLLDVRKRPYILVGATSLGLLVPLAITSTDGWIRRLKTWWPKLHALVYPATILGVAHFYWLKKRDKTEPLQYAAVVGLLLAYRLYYRVRGYLNSRDTLASTR